MPDPYPYPDPVALRDAAAHLTPADLLEAVARQQTTRLPHTRLEAVAEEALAIGHPLLAPAAACREFAVREVAGEQVWLTADETGEAHCLTIGPKADLLAPAHRAVAAVITIGPALEQRVHELNEAGEMLVGYLLDCFGVVALGCVGEALRAHVEQRAASLGWGVGAALGPGTLVGWSMMGQRALCALLPLDEIGVRLNRACVLEPHKSSSTLIGMGPGYEGVHVGSVCQYCSLADTCWRRREVVA